MSAKRNLFLEGGTLVTVDGADRVFTGDMLIRDGVIEALGPPGSLHPSPGTRAVDATGCFVLPGFVQAHVHLCQVLFRGQAEDLALLPWLEQRIWPFEAAHTADSLRASVRLGLAELLLGGTTSALDMGTVHHTDVIFEEARAAGFRLTSGKAMMDSGDACPRGLRETTADSLRESSKLATTWHGAAAGRLRYAFAPRFILSCTPQLLREVMPLAVKHACLVHTHASENPAEVDAVAKLIGKRNVLALAELGICGARAVLAHCVWLDNDEKASLAQQGTRVAHCPSANLKLASGTAQIPELLKLGVHVGLGADGAPCNNRLSAFSEMRQAALLQAPRLGAGALPACDVVRMATLGGAQVLGIDDQVGSLEPGKRADVTIIDGRKPHLSPRTDPFTTIVYAAEAADVRDVFVDGAWLVRQGELVDVHVPDILRDAERELSLLLGRAGIASRDESSSARGEA